MTLSESAFVNMVEATLNRLAAMVEALDNDEIIELEQSGGMLSIALPSGKQFVINRQIPARQIWFSSPVSGGLRFSYNAEEQVWELSDGRRLDTQLKADIEVVLETEEPE